MSLAHSSTPREQCYHGIRHAFNDAMVAYLTKNPHVLSDAARLEETNYALLKALDGVHDVLERYEIEDKQP